jgi:topoisomerase-4 subunit A
MDMLIDVKGWKSVGNRLSNHKVTGVELVESVKQPEKKKDATDQEKKESGDSGEEDDKEQLGLF